ncbi:MAG TPA: DUF2309 domain-containing protein [Flavobacteriales bacterium]|nr:DUF2309 domain-containing protein [Flavobacteriales bacterium]HRJ39175.1 DUF2309 domain-containing protein [Flavobacteriales bacterium]
MDNHSLVFDEQHSLEHLKHYLPAQAALKDFVHHNTLHAFQHEKFHTALRQASNVFGYTTYLSIDEYRERFNSGKIREEILNRTIDEYITKGLALGFNQLKEAVLYKNLDVPISGKIGSLRSQWDKHCSIALDKIIPQILFRLLAAFLDQGIAFWKFPYKNSSFLEAVRNLERNSAVSLFHSAKAKELLLDESITLTDLLFMVVGRESLFEHYLFDQQFAHPGWSGFVAMLETQPETLLDKRKIELRELIILELILEIDALENKFRKGWKPLASVLVEEPDSLFSSYTPVEADLIRSVWQDAFEWSFYDDVLSGLEEAEDVTANSPASMQALLCIDDREYSFRRHIQLVDPLSSTFGTPGFFGVEFYFRPENGKFNTKACPAPVNPSFLIKETNRKAALKSDVHFARNSHSLFRGWLLSMTIGFWSAFRLFISLFKPSVSPVAAYSFSHMDGASGLQIDADGTTEGELKVGFTHEEMALRVMNTLRSIGLTGNFSRLVYVIGHGASSVNNPYYAGYDCGACCGRPGAVNARVFSYMANKPEVRLILAEKGIHIPETTIFIGAMHDTTRDEMEYYDLHLLSAEQVQSHENCQKVFSKALQLNADERSFRFDNVKSASGSSGLHAEIKKRSVSFFEPRPEWNHTANALTIVGRSHLYKHMYLDKRPFINSYDYREDPEGKYLLSILSAAIPVCGGINLEYYFSRVDQQKLGAGTKLPHNVVGLFAVNNGVEGDLRPGLPSQMIEIHDPVRILFVIEHHPEVVFRVISSNAGIYEWIKNEWVHLTVKDPSTGKTYRYADGELVLYNSLQKQLKKARDKAQLEKSYAKNEVVLIN